MTIRVEINPAEPEPWQVARVADVLRKGGVAVIPTDTIYGLACALSQENATERLYGIKGMDGKKRLSILVPDMATAGKFVDRVSNSSFRVMKRLLPGPYTFICPASREVRRTMMRGRDTVGIRIPDDPVVQALLAELGEPMLVTSIATGEEEYVNDPRELAARLAGIVDAVADAGPRLAEPSTIVDATGESPELVRAGKGPWSED